MIQISSGSDDELVDSDNDLGPAAEDVIRGKQPNKIMTQDHRISPTLDILIKEDEKDRETGMTSHDSFHWQLRLDAISRHKQRDSKI